MDRLHGMAELYVSVLPPVSTRVMNGFVNQPVQDYRAPAGGALVTILLKATQKDAVTLTLPINNTNAEEKSSSSESRQGSRRRK